MASNKPLKPCGVAYALSNAKPIRTSKSLFTLLGRVAIVTGAQRGIGLEIALALAEAGAIVYCLDSDSQAGQDFLKVQKFVFDLPDFNIEGQGRFHGGATRKGRLEYVSCDVREQDEVWMLIEKIANKEGRLDICFANAAVLSDKEILEQPGDDFQALMAVNVKGALFAAQGAARQMEKHNIPGTIILTTASMTGSLGDKGMHWTVNDLSKACLVQTTRSLACEFGSKNIRVNSMSPGYIRTDMTTAFLGPQSGSQKDWSSHNPLGRLGSPDELRGVALFLASDASTFCTGSNLVIDGGHRAW